jgi:hypothetical protein
VDVATIARRAQLPIRKIRYVLDQRLLPGMGGRVQENLAGRPRVFTPTEASCVACAALLLEGGAQRRTVAAVMVALAGMPWPLRRLPGSRHGFTTIVAANGPETALEALFAPGGTPAKVLVGDGANLRLQLGDVDTGWLAPRTWTPLGPSYRPSVVIHLDLEFLRTAFADASCHQGFPARPAGRARRSTHGR